jgi:hypothetical protein
MTTHIDVHEYLATKKQIAIIWDTSDVQAIRPDLGSDQAWQVLSEARRLHSAENGITWLTLDYYAEELFGPRPHSYG